MTSRDFNPDTVHLREDIRVIRGSGTTVIANLPRDLQDFEQHDPGLVGQLKSWWKGRTSQRETYPSAQAA